MGRYQIEVSGNIGKSRAADFEGFTCTVLQDNRTRLIGHICDQSALYGLFNKLRDMGMMIQKVEIIQNNEVNNVPG